jgi:hypothetical protein
MKLKPKDLLEAQNELEFAELRAEAQAERERKAEQQRRHDQLITMRESLKKIGEQKRVDESRKRFAEALEIYCQEIAQHNALVGEFRNDLSGKGFQSEKSFPGLETDTGVVVRIGDANAQAVDALRDVRNETDQMLRKYFLREFSTAAAWR